MCDIHNPVPEANNYQVHRYVKPLEHGRCADPDEFHRLGTWIFYIMILVGLIIEALAGLGRIYIIPEMYLKSA